MGVNAVSWAPAMVPGSLVSSKPEVGAQRRFATGGSDCVVKIWDWKYVFLRPFRCLLCLSLFYGGLDSLLIALYPQSREENTYTPTLELKGHTDWVRDVAWAPTVLQKSYIASASQDKTVRIWTSDPAHPNEWKSTVLNFDAVLWRVSWSLSGNVLAVSGGDNKVSLWKENLKGEWDCVKTIEE